MAPSVAFYDKQDGDARVIGSVIRSGTGVDHFEKIKDRLHSVD